MVMTMAENMPRTISEFLSWTGTHASAWDLHAAAIGLSSQEAADFRAAADAVAAANAAAETAREASKNATMVLHNAVARARLLGGAAIDVIKGRAEVTGDWNIYALSGVSPVEPQGTLPPPVAPETFSSHLNPDGSLTIQWSVSQPVGVTDVSYIIARRIEGEGARGFEPVGNEGRNKSFTDRTLPSGVRRVEYMLRPHRGRTMGPLSPVYSVQFGVGVGTLKMAG